MNCKSIFDALQSKFGVDAVFGYVASSAQRLDDYFYVNPHSLVEVMQHLHDDSELHFDYLESLTGVDYPTRNPAQPPTSEPASAAEPATDSACTLATEQSAQTQQPKKANEPKKLSIGRDAPPCSSVQTSARGSIEVVYHLRSYKKKHTIVVKTSLCRSHATAPSLVRIWPAANWHERECFDLLGVVFEQHPDLRRLLLPDDWQGHPLRKDYEQESSYHGIATTRDNPLDRVTINPLDSTKSRKTSEAVS